MVVEKRHAFMQQIDKAAKVIDLVGDIPHAVRILQSVLDDPEIVNYPYIHLEVLVFLAGIQMDLGRTEEAKELILTAECLEFSRFDAQKARHSLEKMRRIKVKLENR
jgi:hypothetical protein